MLRRPRFTDALTVLNAPPDCSEFQALMFGANMLAQTRVHELHIPTIGAYNDASTQVPFAGYSTDKRDFAYEGFPIVNNLRLDGRHEPFNYIGNGGYGFNEVRPTLLLDRRIQDILYNGLYYVNWQPTPAVPIYNPNGTQDTWGITHYTVYKHISAICSFHPISPFPPNADYHVEGQSQCVVRNGFVYYAVITPGVTEYYHVSDPAIIETVLATDEYSSPCTGNFTPFDMSTDPTSGGFYPWSLDNALCQVFYTIGVRPSYKAHRILPNGQRCTATFDGAYTFQPVVAQTEGDFDRYNLTDIASVPDPGGYKFNERNGSFEVGSDVAYYLEGFMYL